MQQHARQRTSRTPLAVHAALPAPGHQSGALQRLLHPRVAQLDPVLLHQLLVKMAHVQIEILLPIQPQHLLHLGQRHPPTTRPAPPPVHQPVIAVRFVSLPPAAHRPVADADDLRRLPPADLLRHGPQNHFLYLHRPLHGGLG